MKNYENKIIIFNCYLILGMLIFLFSLSSIDSISALPIKVQVSIPKIIEIVGSDIQEPASQPRGANYYVMVNIDNKGDQRADDDTQGFFTIGDPTFFIEPGWVFSRIIDTNKEVIPISITLRDRDPLPFNDGFDDDIDINPSPGKFRLDLQFNMKTGKWTGDVPSDQYFSSGPAKSFDKSGSSKLFFDIGTDIDEDGIPDKIELSGVRDLDGTTIVTNMAALGADPCRKSIAVEIDYMEVPDDPNQPGNQGHSHKPPENVINRAINMFNSAPGYVAVANCPYSEFPKRNTGINLILDVSNNPVKDINDNIIHISPLRAFVDLKLPFFGIPFLQWPEFNNVKAFNFDNNKKPYFHYSLWAHNLKFEGIPFVEPRHPTGIAEIGGNDFIISQASLRTENQMLGTFLHELGHNLGLRHGGDQETNCKPNYLSIMNYNFQLSGLPNTRTNENVFDYSRDKLPPLLEFLLHENLGIQDSDFLTTWITSNGTRMKGNGNGPLDWNGDKKFNKFPVIVDLNRDPRNFRCFSFDDLFLSHLTGYSDWDNLKFLFTDRPIYTSDLNHGGDTGEELQELTIEEGEVLLDFWAEELSSDFIVTKFANLTSAIPGDTVKYTINVKNIGKFKGSNIQVIDFLPDGRQEILEIPELDSTASSQHTINFKVPFPTQDGTIISNSVLVIGNSSFGYPDINLLNNNATAAPTIVHTPILTFSKNIVNNNVNIINPGGSIPYEINYQNIGSADAKQVTIIDHLPVNVRYIPELDFSGGPKPNTINFNNDGTTTLIWNIGTVEKNSDIKVIKYTAISSLLIEKGSIRNAAVLDLTDSNNNDYPQINTSITSNISTSRSTKDPQPREYWLDYLDFVWPEILAKIQATDQRFDGIGRSQPHPNGVLSLIEVEIALARYDKQPDILESHLIATYLNLASGRISADTQIDSSLTSLLGIHDVRDAVLFAIDVLSHPPNYHYYDNNLRDYKIATKILKLLNNNLIKIDQRKDLNAYDLDDNQY
jgi:uncharacterized repeat protein (TIGR01451 family)